MPNVQVLALTVLCGLTPMMVCGVETPAGESAVVAVHQPAPGGVLLDFGPSLAPSQIQANSSNADLVSTGDGSALRVTGQAKGAWPGVTISAPDGHWDLSAYSYVSVDLHNVDESDLDIYVRVDNPGANGSAHCMTERIGTQPDQRVTLTIPLKRASNSAIKLSGMHGYPQGLYASGGIDPANIVAFTIFIDTKPAVERRFEISQIRVFGAYEEPTWLTMTPEQFFPFIDAFGQFAHRNWPGKTHSLAEMKAANAEETADLAAHAAPSTWDKWGGWKNGPQLEATGHFRTTKHEGKWWLVDPDGHLFFSVGFNCVRFDSATTAIEQRETWFADLPPAEGDPLSAFRSKKTPPQFDFGAANLYRIYGDEWRALASNRVHQRLRSWGINTIGNWSDWKVCGMKQTPYVRTFFYQVPSLGGGKVKFPDVFAPNFTEALDRGAKQFLGDSGEDPWCIGYFVDNEMAWGGDEGLAGYALTSPATQAAKQAFATWLKERHATIADLNKAWATTWADWDAFLADTKTIPRTAIAKQDLNDFTGVMAEMYFREVKGAIQRIAPHKLYLGCRSVGGSRNVIAAAAKYCDVISYNRYCASVRNVMLPEGIDAPLMIGEFHFGAVDRGPFSGGLFSADNQADRAAKFTTYVQSALDNPQMVGVHWFQYGDQAATGRGDGENYQCGFVDVCDRPYGETIAASRACAEGMYQHRAKSDGDHGR